MGPAVRTVFLPYVDADASLRFYRDALGFVHREDVGAGEVRRLTLEPVEQGGVAVVLEPVASERSATEEERRTLMSLAADGCLARITLAVRDLDAVFERLVAHGAEPLQEPIDRPFGTRDCVFLDPAGTIVRIEEASSGT